MRPEHRETLIRLLAGPIPRDQGVVDYHTATELIELRWIETGTKRFNGLASMQVRTYEITDLGRSVITGTDFAVETPSIPRTPKITILPARHAKGAFCAAKWSLSRLSDANKTALQKATLKEGKRKKKKRAKSLHRG